MHSAVQSSQSLSIDLAQQVEQGKTLYLTNCASCHGPYDTSTKLGRTDVQIRLAIQNIPQMGELSGLNTEQLRAISRSLIYQADGGSIVENANKRLVFKCEANSRPRTAMHKLNNRELRNSVNLILDLFDPNLKNDSQLVDLYSRLPSDIVLESDHTRKEQSTYIDQGVVSASFNLAFRASSLIATSTNLGAFPNTNGCLGQATISQACHQTLIRELGGIVFRRPLPAAEVTTLSTRFWDQTLTKTELLEMTVTGLLQSPDFLYKVYDQGRPHSTLANTLEITPHELATKISYLLTGSPPDSVLRGLANSGEITNPAVLSQQIDRLLATPRAREVMVRFFRESYGYDVFGNFAYPGFFLNGIDTNGLQSAMIDELDNFFASEIITQDTTFSQLMTSRRSQISNGSLAQIYGVSTGSVTLPAERAGFLNRAAMLTKRTGVRASPIKRGLVVLENVLCSSVGMPPPNAPTALPDLGTQVLSTREVAHRTTEVAGTSCVSCHSRINPLGYAFENFDTLGRLRSAESVFDGSNNLRGQVPVSTQAESSDLGTQTVSYANSSELATQIGNSDRAMLCFTKHLKSFEGRRPANSSDNCHMNEALSTLYGTQNQGTVKSAFKSFIMSNYFRYWNF